MGMDSLCRYCGFNYFSYPGCYLQHCCDICTISRRNGRVFFYPIFYYYPVHYNCIFLDCIRSFLQMAKQEGQCFCIREGDRRQKEGDRRVFCIGFPLLYRCESRITKSQSDFSFSQMANFLDIRSKYIC